jgi:hypothetical protein
VYEERRRKREAINKCDNEAEKALLMRELAMFEDQMHQQIREETSEQDAKLQAALEARRKKRGKLIDEVNKEKHGAIKQAY